MIPDVSKALTWLESHPDALNGIRRGIERETLRVTPEGQLAASGHPEALGKALTHPWITTDFAESLLEFITPVDASIDHMLPSSPIFIAMWREIWGQNACGQ